jgi:hypothetical protein
MMSMVSQIVRCVFWVNSQGISRGIERQWSEHGMTINEYEHQQAAPPPQTKAQSIVQPDNVDSCSGYGFVNVLDVYPTLVSKYAWGSMPGLCR